MKKISTSVRKFIPASHEDQDNPSALKFILFTDKDLDIGKRVKMINWARLLPKKSFVSHYHEDMDEIFIIIAGKAKIVVGGEKEILEKGDAVFIPVKKVHQMEDIGGGGVEYVVIGLSQNLGGKTILVR